MEGGATNLTTEGSDQYRRIGAQEASGNIGCFIGGAVEPFGLAQS